MKKNLLSLALSLCLLLALAPPAYAMDFADVAPDSPYRDAIQWAVENGVTKGTTATTFAPNQTCSLAHIMTFYFRCFYPEDLADTAAEIGSERAVINELCKEFAAEFSPASLDPNQPCTRALAVTLLWMEDGNSYPDSAFSDVPADAYYADAVDWAVQKGITTGTSASSFSPDATCTRGQIVTFLYRMRQNRTA